MSRSRRLSARYGAALGMSILALMCVFVFRQVFGTDIFAVF